MIIDVHNHVMTLENIPDAYWNEMAKYIATLYKELINRDVTVDEVKKHNLDPLISDGLVYGSKSKVVCLRPAVSAAGECDGNDDRIVCALQS